MQIVISILVATWLLAAMLQLYYWLVVAARLPAFRPAPGGIRSKISVVICAHRAYPTLPALLEVLARQSHKDYEVILVNDGPDPKVARMVQEARNPGLELKTVSFDSISKSSPGKKEPLAAGIKAARGEWILLTDADCMVSAEWIESMAQRVRSGKHLVLGFAPLRKQKGFVNALSRFDNLFIGIQYLSMALAGKPYMGVGRNLMYKKQTFENSQGFEPHSDLASGDDDLFVQQVASKTNTTINTDPQSYAWSEAPQSLRELIAQKRRHTSTARYYRQKFKRSLLLYGASFALFWIGAILVLFMGETIPVIIALSGMVSQWIVFVLAAGKLNNTSYQVTYPVWCVLYAVFVIALGILSIQKPPAEWNS